MSVQKSCPHPDCRHPLPETERTRWLWAAALVSVNPVAIQLQRKIWDTTGYLIGIVYGGSATSNVIAVGDPARCPAVNSIVATWTEMSGRTSRTDREGDTPMIKAFVFDAYGTLFDVHSAAARHRDLGYSGDAAVVVDGDSDALRMLLGNLVDNAIRYTQAGGTIDVVATDDSAT